MTYNNSFPTEKGRRMYYCVPGLSGGGIEPAAERGSECEVSVGMAFFEHCLPFGPCKGAWLVGLLTLRYISHVTWHGVLIQSNDRSSPSHAHLIINKKHFLGVMIDSPINKSSSWVNFANGAPKKKRAQVNCGHQMRNVVDTLLLIKGWFDFMSICHHGE